MVRVFRNVLSVALPLLIGGTVLVVQPAAADQALIPERRAVLMADTDLPGGDLGKIFDSSLQACVQSCAADAKCVSLTYNQRARACFPKSASAGEPAAFAGALSGRIVDAAPALVAQAAARRGALKVLSDNDAAGALRQAGTMAAEFPPGLTADATAEARQAEAEGDLPAAIRMMSSAVAGEDRPDQWRDLARMLVQAAEDSGGSAEAAASAAINAYLRAESDEAAADSLVWLATAWERRDRGRDALRALQLASTLAPSNPAILDELAKSQERNGFRVTDSGPQSGSTSPRFCATLSQKLAESTDYAPFVRSAINGVAVEASGSELCLTGMSYGQEVAMTLRAGLPAADGEKLAKDVTVTGYIRDRSPSVRFAGRGYVLPAGGDQGLAMTTVNTDRVDIELLKISDRNLIRTMSEGLFAVPLDGYRSDYFSDNLARTVWKGTAEVAKPVGQETLNRDVTSRLAIPKAAGPLDPGIYIVQATLPGHDTDSTGVATQWFVISDFGISTLSGTDGLTVVVRSLASAGPKAGAEVALISRANDILGRAVTDAEGVARFPAGLMRGDAGAAPAMVTVSQWQGEGEGRTLTDTAFLSLTDPEFDLSDRGVEGRAPAPAIDLFVTTDRGAYRAGETVNATILARDPQVKALDGLPLTAVIRRPDGVEQARVTPAPAGAGGATLSWTLPGTAQRGSWRIELRAEADGPALADARILVEDFLPERIDFTTALPEGPAKAGSDLPIDITARWLFGAPAAALPVEASLRLAPAKSLSGFDGFVFGRHDDAADPETVTLPAGVTDDQGRFTATATLPDAARLEGRLTEATLSVELREGAGRPVERSASVMIAPGSPVVGIKSMQPGGEVDENGTARFQVVALGPDLRPAPTRLRWVLNRVETEYEWYSMDGSWSWEPSTRRTRIKDGTVEAGTEPATVEAAVDWGQFELVVEPENGGGGTASTTFWAGWGAAASAGTDTPDRLKVTLDRGDYRPGDTAKVSVEAAAPATGLVTVLSNRVVALQTVALKQGMNSFDLPVTDEWGSGVYVTVSALRPVDGIAPDDHRPVRALGLAHAAVDPGARKLAATLTVPDHARPRGDLPVELAVTGAAPGATVYATVAAVDQGILNLTSFASPDPSAHYFGQRRLGVGLRDLYGRLILPSGAPDGALREGGDAQMPTNREAPPPTEKLMSWFSGPVTLDAQGKAQLAVPVADFNGEIRVMAVVWTESAVGQAEATSTLSDPVVMTVTAPQFLAPGDTAQIGLLLTHVDGPAGTIEIATEDMGDVTLSPGAISSPVKLADKGEARVTLPITAGDGDGVARLRLSATLPGGAVVTKNIAVPILMGEPEISRQDEITLAPGASQTVPPSLTQGLLPGATVTMAAGDFARLDVAAMIARLDRYPYGCTEQLASTAMPLLYLPKLAALSGGRDGTTRRSVAEAIDEMLTRQTSGGAFGLWSPSSGDLWLSAYATDFLSRARAQGHKVPDAAFRSAILNLQNAVNIATDPQAADASDNAALAYAVAVLARERAATVGDLRYYADTAAGAFSTPMSSANLGAALAAYGDQPRADKMFRQAMAQITDQQRSAEKPAYRTDYGTRLRDQAAVLALATEAGSQALDRSALVSTVAATSAAVTARGGVSSTQEAVWTVLAANALGAQSGAGLSVNGAPLDSAVSKLAMPGTDVLANTGKRPVDLRLTAMGQPAESPVAWGNGYSIARSYYDMDGKALDPTLVSVGQRMVAVIEVTPLGSEGGRLIVNDPLPAGFEIDNPHLLQSGDVSSLDWVEGQTDPDMAQFLADRFTAALTWNAKEPFKLAYVLRAVTPGQFRHPAASVEDMYRPERRAWTDGGRVTVAP